jgi:hypothetical protein
VFDDPPHPSSLPPRDTLPDPLPAGADVDEDG